MARKYQRIQHKLEQIKEMLNQGMTQKEVEDASQQRGWRNTTTKTGV